MPTIVFLLYRAIIELHRYTVLYIYSTVLPMPYAVCLQCKVGGASRETSLFYFILFLLRIRWLLVLGTFYVQYIQECFFAPSLKVLSVSVSVRVRV